MARVIENPGSALGEAIGAQMELALNRFLGELADRLGHHFVSQACHTPGSKQTKKLLLYDDLGTAYEIDSVIANASMQPIVLVECKYIRYAKHNRDKGSWICTAHGALRRRYSSIRCSLAVLAGTWTKSSLAMIRSHHINVFIVPFDYVCCTLEQHGVKFDWDEKDRPAARLAWETYDDCPTTQRQPSGKVFSNRSGLLLRSRLRKSWTTQSPGKSRKCVSNCIPTLAKSRSVISPQLGTP